MSVNPLAGFLARAFPAHVCFPPDCWVRRAIEQNYEGYDVGAAVEVALQEGSEAAIAVRLRLEHPAARAHLSRHDDGLLNAFTAVEALAWASRVARIGLCEFVTTQGAPDLRVGDTHWIEAKTIQRSNSDTRALEEACREAAASGDMLVRSGTIGDIGPGLVAKFDSQFQDALLKWKRQRQMANFVVFTALKVSIGTSTATMSGPWLRTGPEPARGVAPTPASLSSITISGKSLGWIPSGSEGIRRELRTMCS